MNQSSILTTFLIIIVLFVACDKPEEKVKNQKPIVSFTAPANNSIFMLGDIVEISVVAEDVENDISEVRFYANDIALGSDQVWPYGYSWDTESLTPGNYIVKAEALEDGGGKGADSINIIIEQHSPFASFSVDPPAGIIGTVIYFDASTSSDIEDSHEYLQVRWDWENDGTWDTGFSSTKTASNQYTIAGSFTIKMEVIDSYGATSDTTHIITIVDETVSDVDGNVYDVIQFGNQIWMAENLRTTTFRDGSPINLVSDNNTWLNITNEAYCYHPDAANFPREFGAIYNWYAITDPNGLAPEGWHIPTDDEWKELEIFLGMNETDADRSYLRGTNEGSRLAGYAPAWADGLLNQNAEFGTSGFQAYPAGWRGDSGGGGQIIHATFIAKFWNITEYGDYLVGSRELNFNNEQVERRITDRKSMGCSVRCVLD